MHVSNSFNIFFIEIPFIGTLDAMAYINLEPLQLRLPNFGEEQFLLLMVMPKYLKTLTFSIIWWFIVNCVFLFECLWRRHAFGFVVVYI